MDWTSQDKARQRGEDRQSMGARFPIWHAALAHKEFKRTLTAGDGKSCPGLNLIRLPALSRKGSIFVNQLPDLVYLSERIAGYLLKYHQVNLGIQVSLFLMLFGFVT